VQADLLALETTYTNQAYNIGTARATSIKDVCESRIKELESDLKMKIEPTRLFDYPIVVYGTSVGYNVTAF